MGMDQMRNIFRPTGTPAGGTATSGSPSSAIPLLPSPVNGGGNKVVEVTAAGDYPIRIEFGISTVSASTNSILIPANVTRWFDLDNFTHISVMGIGGDSYYSVVRGSFPLQN
jgi:hypothetical protein